MATILPFLRNGIYFRDSVFEPHDIEAMSRALNDVCAVLKLQDDNPAKEVMATRIIDLARRGKRSPTRLRDRVLHEAGLAHNALKPKKPIRHPKLSPPPISQITPTARAFDNANGDDDVLHSSSARPGYLRLAQPREFGVRAPGLKGQALQGSVDRRDAIRARSIPAGNDDIRMSRRVASPAGRLPKAAVHFVRLGIPKVDQDWGLRGNSGARRPPLNQDQCKAPENLRFCNGVAAVVLLACWLLANFAWDIAGRCVSRCGRDCDTGFARRRACRTGEPCMSHARNFDCLIVIAAVILATAGAATVFSLLHRPVLAESVAEVSRPMAADTSVAQPPTEAQEVKSSYVPRWGVWLAADLSESRAWAIYRERSRHFASLIGDREPVMLFRQLPGMEQGAALHHRHCRRRSGSARQVLREAHGRRQQLQRHTQRAVALTGSASGKKRLTMGARAALVAALSLTPSFASLVISPGA